MGYDHLLEYQLGADVVACHVRKSGPRNYDVMNMCSCRILLNLTAGRGSPGVHTALSVRCVPSPCHNITNEKWVLIHGVQLRLLQLVHFECSFPDHVCPNVE